MALILGSNFASKLVHTFAAIDLYFCHHSNQEPIKICMNNYLPLSKTLFTACHHDDLLVFVSAIQQALDIQRRPIIVSAIQHALKIVFETIANHLQDTWRKRCACAGSAAQCKTFGPSRLVRHRCKPHGFGSSRIHSANFNSSINQLLEPKWLQIQLCTLYDCRLVPC